MTTTPWRKPNEETEDFPGFTVHDGRVSGSITFGQTRLPVWAIIGELVRGEGWKGCLYGYGADDNSTDLFGVSDTDLTEFLYNLLEMRGDFGRLLCVLADVERLEDDRYANPWWEDRRARRRVADALRRCLAVVANDE